MCLVYKESKFEFIEYQFEYVTSSSHCNHLGMKHDGYVAVIDGKAINLTPLGKFLMPPPMFKSQIKGLNSVPTCIALFGNLGLAYLQQTRQFISFNCNLTE